MRHISYIILFLVLIKSVAALTPLPDCCAKAVDEDKVRSYYQQWHNKANYADESEWNTAVEKSTLNFIDILKPHIKECQNRRETETKQYEQQVEMYCRKDTIMYTPPSLSSYNADAEENINSYIKTIVRFISNTDNYYNSDVIVTKDGKDLLTIKKNLAPQMVKYIDNANAQKIFKDYPNTMKEAFFKCGKSNKMTSCIEPCSKEGKSDCYSLCGIDYSYNFYNEFRECFNNEVKPYCETYYYLKRRKAVVDSCDLWWGSEESKYYAESGKEIKVEPKTPVKEVFKRIGELMNKNWKGEFLKWHGMFVEKNEQIHKETIAKNKGMWFKIIDMYSTAKFDLGAIDSKEISEDLTHLKWMLDHAQHPDLKLNKEQEKKLKEAIGALEYQDMVNKYKEALVDAGILNEDQFKRLLLRTHVTFDYTRDTAYNNVKNEINIETPYQGDGVSPNLKLWKEFNTNQGEDMRHEYAHAVFDAIITDVVSYNQWDDTRLSRLREYTAKINPYDDYDEYKSGQNVLGGEHYLDAPAENEYVAFNEGGSHFGAFAMSSDGYRWDLMNKFEKLPQGYDPTKKDLYELNAGYVLMTIYNPYNKEGNVVEYNGGGVGMFSDYTVVLDKCLDDKKVTLKEFIDERRKMPGWNEEAWKKTESRLKSEGRI